MVVEFLLGVVVGLIGGGSVVWLHYAEIAKELDVLKAQVGLHAEPTRPDGTPVGDGGPMER